MRKLLCFVLLLFLYIGRAAAAESPPAGFWPDGSGLVFRENRGQIKDTKGAPRPDVLYTAEANGVQLFFQKNRVSYVYPKFEERKSLSGKMTPQTVELYRMDWELLGANPQAAVRSENVSAAAGVNNYVYKHCPQGILGVKAYEKIIYENVWNNIDLVFYTAQESNGKKAFKYDFVVKPGGKVSDIRIRYTAHDRLNLNPQGGLSVVNPLGRLDENAPVSFQGKETVATRFVVNGDVVTFDVNRYDPAQNLTIDPLTLVWGSYYGGTRNENANSLTIDRDNNPIFVGSTKSTDFPVNIGKNTLTNDYADAYVVKFNSAGARQWGTYYGGSDDDEAYDVYTDPRNGNIAVTGASGTIVGPLPEGDFPTTPGAAQNVFGGGRLDAIMMYFTPLGAPVWSSFWGGGTGGAPNSTQEGEDQGRGIVINQQGEIIMVGFTICVDFPLAQGGSVNYNNNSGGYDAIVTKWNASNGSIVWSTYYGSTLDDAAEDVDIDAQGNFYVTGYTKSASFPIAGAAHQPTCNSCLNNLEDAFLLKFNAGTSLAWGTFYGGPIDDRGKSVSVSRDGNIVYMVGSTNSNANISTPGSFQANYGGSTDAMIIRFNGTTGQRVWGSYIGDASTDNGMSVTQNAAGNPYVVGFTASNSFPTKFALQNTKDASTDGFLTVINANGRSTRYSTFYGGNNRDRANGVALDNTGLIYVSGETQSTNLRLNAPIFQNANRGGQEAFIIKLNCAPIPFAVTASGLNQICANSGCVNLTTNPAGVRFFGPGVRPGSAGSPDQFCPEDVNRRPGSYTLKAYLADACNDSVDVTVTVIDVPTATVTGVPPSPICQGSAAFALNVTLSDGSTPTSVTFSGPNVSNNRFDPRTAGTFEVSGTIVTARGCTLTTTTSITVVPNPVPTIALPAGANLCELNNQGIQLILTPPGGILTGPGASGSTFTPAFAGGPGVKRLTYEVNQNGCRGTATLDVTVTPAQDATINIQNAPAGNRFCVLDNNTYTVVTNVPGGVLSVATIRPSSQPAGFYTITVTVPQGQCFRPTTINYEITPAIPANIFLSRTTVCETDNTPVTVNVSPAGTLTATPGGLSLQGSGTSFTINPPFTAGTYTLRLVPTAGTCAAETTATFTVTVAPPTVITGVTAGQRFCAGDNNSYPLSVTPAGITGSWFVGSTQIGNAFIPSQHANPPGTKTIRFVPGPGQCARESSINVEITPQVQSSITGITNGQSFCTTNTSTIQLTGNPAGGTWSLLPASAGFNTANGSFVPSQMQPGSYTVTLTPAQANCALPASISFVIVQAQRSFISGVTAGQTFCVADNQPKPLSANPPGGIFSGPGVSGNNFTPSLAGVNPNACIIYTPSNTTCALPETLCVVVNEQIRTTLTADPAGPYCATSTTPIRFNLTPLSIQASQGVFTIQPAAANFSASGILNPPFTAGSYTITWTPNPGVCAVASTVNISITESPLVNASITPAGPFCVNDDRSYPITTVPPNCTCVGPGVSNNQFTPRFAGAGTHTITCTPPAGSCFRPGTFTVTVNPLQPSSITGITNGQTFCINDCNNVSLAGTPAGGTWSITPNVAGFNGTFQPCSLQTGFYNVVYTPSAASCSSPSNISFSITPAQPSFIGGVTEGQRFCITNTQPVQLFGTPPGGTFSGNGVSGNNFTPSTAGVGTHVITYTPPSNVCASVSRITVIVEAEAVPTITANPTGPYCSTSTTPINFTLNPAGLAGTWSVSPATITINPSTGSITPNNAPSGTYTVTFTPNPGVCARTATTTIVITESPLVNASITPAGPFCVNDDRSYPITTVPPNCTCAGPGVSNNQFTPRFAGAGTHTITCTPPAGSCFRPGTFTVTVNPLQPSSIAGITNGQTFCSTDSRTQSLNGTPGGGTWSIQPATVGFNLTNGSFVPSGIQPGFYTVTYTPSAAACSSPSNISFSITPAQRSFIGGIAPGQQFCVTDNQPRQLFGTPSGGTFSGPGVSGNNFTPSVAGANPNVCIIYTPPVEACALPETLCLVVTPERASRITSPIDNSVYCRTDNRSVPITVDPTGQGEQIFINDRFTGNSFVPSTLTPGTYTIEVRYPAAACVASSRVTITISDAPTPTITGVTAGQQFCITDNNGYPLAVSPVIDGRFEGPGVSGGRFTPSAAGAGSHIIRFIPADNACGLPAQTTVVVNPQTQSSIFGIVNGQTFCETVCTQVNLSGQPAGGTFTLSPNNPNFVNGTFTACSLAVGSYTVTYTPTAASCASPSTITFSVTAAPAVNITGITAGQVFCSSDQSGYPLAVAPFVNGTFSGPGVSGNSFFPRGLNGNITITWTPGQNECARATSINVRVANELEAVISGLPTQPICATVAPFNITGSPTGGTFTFNGIAGGTVVNPAQFAPPGTTNPVTVTVVYTPPAGSCARPTTGSFIVTPATPASITLSPNNGNNICTTATFTVTGSPAGGTFTIDGQPLGNNPATVNASLYGTGNKTIIYRGRNGACEYAETLNVTLNAPPTVQIGGLAAFPYCPTVDVATPLFGTPAGGTFSGPGVVGTSFIPSRAGAGVHQICYSGTFRGCEYRGCTTVTVRNAVTPTLSGMAREYCIEDTNLYTFTATPPGGTFTGQGLNQVENRPFARFRPRNSTFRPGIVTITYFGEFDGCPYYIDTTINILPSTPSTITPPRSVFCISDNAEYDFTVAPLGGRIVGQGVVNNRFSPARAGVGFWKIDYLPQAGAGCNQPSATFVTVAPSFLELTLSLTGQNTVRADVSGASGQVRYTLNGADQGTNNVFPNQVPGTTVRVCAIDESGCSVCREITIQAQRCDCPQNITASAIGIFSATVTWTANPNAQSYRVEYRPTGSGTFESRNVFTNSISLTGLQASTAYDVRVISICNGTESTPCSITLTTFDCKAPDFFEAVEVRTNSATLEWDVIPGAFGYEIQYKELLAPESAYIPVPARVINGAENNRTTFDRLNAAVDYVARVRTICEPGQFSPWVFAFYTTENCENTALVEVKEVTCSTAVVTWTPVPGAFGYIVTYTNEDLGSGPVEIRLGPVTTTTIQNLAEGTNYRVSVTTICDNGNGISVPTFSEQPTFTTDRCNAGECPAPLAVTVDVFAETREATVTWAPVDNATSYIVEYRRVGSPNFITLVANDFTIDLTGLECPANYEVRVRAVCGNNASPFANATFALVNCGGTTCPIPRNLAVNVYRDENDYAVRFTWRTVAPEGHYYEVQYARINEAYGTILPVNVDAIDDTMYYHITRLECPQDYKVRVRTVCFDESRSEWAEINFRINLCNQPGNCPAVQNLRVDETTNISGVISFNRVNEAASYTVNLSDALTGTFVRTVNVPQSSNPVIVVSFDNLTPDSDYRATVIVNCTNGRTSEGRDVVFRTIDCQSPFRFDIVEPVTFSTISVDWDEIPGALGYQVELKLLDAPSYDGSRLVSLPATQTEYTFTGLQTSNRYEVRVRQICARDQFGNPISFSPWTYNTGNTLDCEAIIGLPEITATEPTFAAVNWTGSGGEVTYLVEISDNDGTTWNVVERTTNTFSFLQGLKSCTNYQVRVSVICGDGSSTSAPSLNIFTTGCTVTCAAPQNLTVTAKTQNSISLSWTRPSGPGTVEAYFIQYRVAGTSGEFVPAFPGLSAGLNTTFTVPGLLPATRYEIVVRAKCTGSGSDYSDPVTITEPTDDPSGNNCGTVQNLNAVAVNDAINVVWSAPTTGNVIGYRVTYTPAPNTGDYAGNGKFVTGTSDRIAPLANGTYTVTVRAVCRDNNGNEVIGDPTTTPQINVGGGQGDCQAVSQISIVGPRYTFVGNNLTASLSWGAVPGANVYEVAYRQVGASNYIITLVNAPTTTLTLSNSPATPILPNTAYEWYILTRCANGGVSDTTRPTNNPTVTPGSSCDAPGNVLLTDVRETSVTVTWTGSPANRYRVRWRRSKDADNQWLDSVIVANRNDAVISGLEPGTIYLVQVKTLCPTGGGPNGTDPTSSPDVSREVTTNGGECIVPQVSILSGTVTCTNARIVWTESALAGQYEVQIKESTSTLWNAPETVQGGSFEFRTLNASAEYLVRVRALCRGGSETSSYDTVRFRTPSCVPGENSIWQITSGGLGWDESHSAVRSSDGGYVVTGYTFSWGAGEWDVYLAKYNAFGGKVWDKTFGTPNRDEGRSIRQTNDGGYIITGYTNGKGNGTNVYVIKTDELGNLMWERSYGNGSYQVGYDIRQTAEGGYIITGTNLQVGAGARDVQLIKIDASGALEWQRTYGGTADDYGYSVVQTNDGGYAVAGYTQSVGAGRQDLLVMKTSSTGAVLWAKTVGGSDRDFGYGLAQDANGDLVAVGYSRSFGEANGDVLVTKFDENGNTRWVKTVGNNSFDFANGVVTTGNGDVVITGATGANNTDATFIRLNGADGSLASSATYGGVNTDQGRTVISAGDEGFVIAGQSNSFDQAPEQKNAEVYLIRTDKDGLSCATNTRLYDGIAERTPSVTPADVTAAITAGTRASNLAVTSAAGSIADEPTFTVFAACALENCTEVTNLTVNEIKGNSATVTWTGNGAIAYRVRYRVSGGVFTPETTITTTSLTIAIVANTNYEVEVRSVCNLNSFSGTVATTFNSGEVSGCDAPTNVTITNVTRTTAVVNWSGTPGALGYLVRYRPVNGTTFITVSVAANQGTHPLTNLTANTRYEVQVGTLCASGTITYSLVYPFQTLARMEEVQESFTSLTLYPNPTRGEVVLNYTATSTEPATIIVTDLTGKTILTQVINSAEGLNEVPVDLTGNAAGIYLMRFTQGTQSQTMKVVLQ